LLLVFCRRAKGPAYFKLIWRAKVPLIVWRAKIPLILNLICRWAKVPLKVHLKLYLLLVFCRRAKGPAYFKTSLAGKSPVICLAKVSLLSHNSILAGKDPVNLKTLFVGRLTAPL